MFSILIPNRNEPKIVEMLMALDELFGPGVQIIVAQDRESRGKGWALRQALGQAKGDLICFIDGDMDIHPRMILRLLPFIDDYDIVVGKKQIRGIPSRRILTRLSRWLIQALFGLGVDTQTGIKLFRREALPYWKENGFMFDLEILAKSVRAGNTLIEVPVEANIERKMAGRSVVKCLWAAFKIRMAI